VDPNNLAVTYWFEYSRDPGLKSGSITATPGQTLSVGNSEVSVKADVSNLDPHTKYYVRLVARSSAGTVNGDVVSFSTK
jgi:phosphodiesterase/alkaline phosphatase D-like protein